MSKTKIGDLTKKRILHVLHEAATVSEKSSRHFFSLQNLVFGFCSQSFFLTLSACDTKQPPHSCKVVR